MSLNIDILRTYKSNSEIHLQNLRDMKTAFTYPKANAAFIQSHKDYLQEAMQEITLANEAILAGQRLGYRFQRINDEMLGLLDEQIMREGLSALGIQSPIDLLIAPPVQVKTPTSMTQPMLNFKKILANPIVQIGAVTAAVATVGNLALQNSPIVQATGSAIGNAISVIGDHIPFIAFTSAIGFLGYQKLTASREEPAQADIEPIGADAASVEPVLDAPNRWGHLSLPKIEQLSPEVKGGIGIVAGGGAICLLGAAALPFVATAGLLGYGYLAASRQKPADEPAPAVIEPAVDQPEEVALAPAVANNAPPVNLDIAVEMAAEHDQIVDLLN